MNSHKQSHTRTNASIRDKHRALQSAIELLQRAYEYADEIDHDVWEFAIEAPELSQRGLASCDLRWLLVRGYVEHAVETTRPFDRRRAFRPAGPNEFCDESCFILTAEAFGWIEAAERDLGAALFPAMSALSATSALTDGSTALHSLADGSTALQSFLDGDVPSTGRPTWNIDRKELRFTGTLVKQFKWPAINQEMILSVFEEEGWPARIDDPLPRVAAQEPKRRLHDTVKCLNRNQRHRLVRFRGDGTGEGVIWEAVDNAHAC